MCGNGVYRGQNSKRRNAHRSLRAFAGPRCFCCSSEGPHAILREGARIITSAQDLLDDLGLTPTGQPELNASKQVKLTPVQKKIVAQLRIQELTPQELAQACDLPVNDVITELGTLEIVGVVTREAGNRFHLPLAARE